METPTNEARKPTDLASDLNTELARRVTRWKRLRLAIAIVLCGIGIVLAFFNSVAVFAAPLFIGAFIAYLLYLDARDEAREVETRKWGSATPRISKLAGVKHDKSAQDSPSQK